MAERGIHVPMKRLFHVRMAAVLSVLLAFVFSTGCEENRAAEARPCDIAARVADEFEMKGVLLSDIGIREAYVRARELVGDIDGLNGWAVFLPYNSARNGDGSGGYKSTVRRHFPTSFRTAVENVPESADSEFGILLTYGGSSFGDERLKELERRIKERLGGKTEVRQCGNFILYGRPYVLDAATNRLYTVD